LFGDEIRAGSQRLNFPGWIAILILQFGPA